MTASTHPYEQLHRGEHLMSGLGRLLAEVDAYLAFWDLARDDDGRELMLEAYPHGAGAVERIGWYTAADR